MDVLFWVQRDFQISFSNRDTPMNVLNRHRESFMVDTGILSCICNSSLTNVEWHSVGWPYAMPTSHQSNFIHHLEAPKLKVSLTDPPIFKGFVIGEASGDDRPTIGRRFEEIYLMISAEGRPIIGCQSTDDRQTVRRSHLIKQPLLDRRRISTVIRPMIDWMSADDKMCFLS